MNKVINSRFQSAIGTLPYNSVQLCFTSPPYEDMVTYREKDGRAISEEGRRAIAKGIDAVFWEERNAYIDEYWDDLFYNLEPRMKEDGCVGIVVNDKRNDGSISTTQMDGVICTVEVGWKLIEHVCWLKTQGTPRAGNRLQDWWEHIYIFSRSSKPKLYPDRIRGMYSPSTIRRYGYNLRSITDMTNRNLSKGQTQKRHRRVDLDPRGKLLPNILVVPPDLHRKAKHPAKFPLALPKWAITLCTDIDDLVIDPMCGSCTTLIAAKMMCRNYWGCDMGRDYVEAGKIELEKTLAQRDFYDGYSVPVPTVQK